MKRISNKCLNVVNIFKRNKDFILILFVFRETYLDTFCRKQIGDEYQAQEAPKNEGKFSDFFFLCKQLIALPPARY